MTSLQLEKRLNILQWVIVALLVIVIAVPPVAIWWLSRQLPVVNTVQIDNMQMHSPVALCPGDPLIVSYNFHAQGAGVLVRDWTLWSTTPPKTVIFSTSRRFILDGPIDQHLTETWHIPPTYLNFETEHQEPLPPGNYRRFLAISSPSRSSVIDIDWMDFVIKANC